MGDFNLPTTTSNYGDVPGQILANINSVALMFSGTTDSNVPVGAIQYDATNLRLNKWDGAAWQPTAIGNLAAGAVTKASLGANVVDDTKFRGNSAGWLRWRNAANSADLNVLEADADDNTVLNAATGKAISLAINGAAKWQLLSTGHLAPTADGTLNFGSASFRIANAYIEALNSLQSLSASGNDLILNATTAHRLAFYTNNNPRWLIDSNGHLVPNNAVAFNIGSSSVGAASVFAVALSAPNAADLQINAPSGQGVQFAINGTNHMEFLFAGGKYGLISNTDTEMNLGFPANRWGTVFALNLGDGTHFMSNAYVTNYWLTPTIGLSADTGSGNPIFTSFPTAPTAGAAQGYLRFQFANSGTVYKIPYFAA